MIHIIPTCSMNLETAVTMHWWSFQPSSFCSELDASMGCNWKDSFTGERSRIQSNNIGEVQLYKSYVVDNTSLVFPTLHTMDAHLHVAVIKIKF